MRSSRLAFGATVVLSLTGCFRSASVTDAGSFDAAACTPLATNNLLVQPTASGTTPAPAPTGGALVAGNYHLAATVYYPTASCTPTEVSTNLRLTLSSAASGTFETITATAAGDNVSESARFTVVGTELSLRLDCISPDPTGLTSTAAVIPYTVDDAGQILLTSSDPTCGVSVSTYAPDGP